MTRRILLIEDEPLSQDIITALLRGQGYEVDVAMDGFAALDRARAVRYDVALIDYHLPEMDGYALGRLLREQHPADADGPVLIGLTADRTGLAARRGSDAVFRAILPKPIKPADLFSTIERLCEVTGPAATAMNDMAEPGDARRAAAALWRSHGLALPPKAFVSPPPTEEQAAALGLCFALVAAEAAQCIVLLERHGINEALRVARRSQGATLPIVGISADHADICDSLFRIDDPASWKALAVALGAEKPAASIIPLPMPQAAAEPMPAPLVEERAAEPAPVAHAVASAPAMPEIRALLLDGVRAPLDQLRRDLAAGLRTPEPAERRQDLLGQLAALDSMLLVTGTIADALNTTTQRATEATIFDPAELAENALAMIRDSLPPGAVRLSCRITEGLPRLLRGDAHRLSQAVLTLLDDACAGSGAVALTLTLGFDDKDGVLTLRLSQSGGAGEAEDGRRRAAAQPAPDDARAPRRADGRNADAGGRRNAPEAAGAGGSRGAARPHRWRGRRAGPCPAGRRRCDERPASDPAADAERTPRLPRRRQRGGALRLPRGPARPRHLRFRQWRIGASGVLDAVRRFQAAQTGVPALALANAVSAQDEARLRGWGVMELLAKPFSPEALNDAVAACRAARAESPCPALASIDAKVRDALAQALGSATVERLTGQLLAQIEPLAGEPLLPDEAKARLIELAGCACVLGLPELAAHCATPTDGMAIGAALERLRQGLELPRRAAA